MKFIKLLFILFLLFPVIFSTPAFLDTAGKVKLPQDFNAILVAGSVGVTIGILLGALAYMIGHIFGLPQMIGWSKDQIWESLYSLILVSTILIFSLVVFAFPVGVEDAINSSSQLTFPEKAALSLDNVIYGKIKVADLPKDLKKEFEESGFIASNNLGLKNLFFSMFSSQAVLYVMDNLLSLQMVPSINFYFNFVNTAFQNPIQGDSSSKGNIEFSGNLIPGIKKIAEMQGVISNYLLTTIIILFVQIGLLVFISEGSIFFLTFGIFFRTIPTTRKLGSTLIAIFITLYFVYPSFVLFAYSDGMYGKMSEEFAGMYMNSQWLEGLEDVDPQILIITEPYGINFINSTHLKKEEIILKFYSTITEYNYTIKNSEGNEICKGIGGMGEVISCDLEGIKINKLFDPNKDSELKERVAFIQKLEDLKNKGTPFYDSSSEITIQFSHTWKEYYYDGSERIREDYYPKDPLKFRIFFTKECSSDLCFQEIQKISYKMEEIQKLDANSQLLGSVQDSLKNGIPGQGLADGTVFVTKGIIGGLAGYFGGPNAGIIVTALLYKSDILGFFYDELTCDPYTDIVAVKYFKASSNLKLRDSKSYFDEFNKITTSSFTPEKFYSQLYDSTASMYSENDYTSCSSGLIQDGAILSTMIGTLSGQKIPSYKSTHMTATFAPIAYVFIAFIYTIIFTVTFFRSLSESIGGDPSLLGLGKLL